MIFKPCTTILFQGDSITDAGCSEKNRRIPIGGGYVSYIAAMLQAKYPGLALNIVNKGISGNRVRDLQLRWTEDCIAVKPDMVSVLVGINDCLRAFDSNAPTSAEGYYKDYKSLLNRVKDEVGDIPLVLLEPFALPVVDDYLKWRTDLDLKIQMARVLSREFGAYFVPLDGIFAAECTRINPTHWSEDGVHPTAAGHYLIAKAWMNTVCESYQIRGEL